MSLSSSQQTIVGRRAQGRKKDGKRLNAVASTTYGGRFTGEWRMEVKSRVENILKTWRQGPEYMSYYNIAEAPTLENFFSTKGNGGMEHEYIVIGRVFDVIDEKRISYY